MDTRITSQIILVLALCVAFTACKKDEVTCPDGKAAPVDANGKAQACPTTPGDDNGDQDTPNPPTPPTPPAPPPPPVEPPQPPRDPDNTGFDVFKDVAYPMALDVDAQYPQHREWLESRLPRQADFPVDHCDANLETRYTFADRLAYNVQLRTTARKPQISYVASYFGLSSDANTYAPTSLISHALCPLSKASFTATYQGKNIPSAAVIDRANKFSSLINKYRSQALAGSSEGMLQHQKLWTKFMMCLGYMESLTTADSSKADQIARDYGFRRPAGVNMSMDPAQSDPASKFAVGIFQLSADAGGIAQSCLREWNEIYPRCQVKKNATWKEMIYYLGSSLQTFNTFCGVSKVTAMFGVQVNSKKAFNTHPANVNSNGTLKASAERCVSPFMNVNTSYNHFGPFQNVYGFTLDQVLTCTLKGEPNP